jgi:mannose-1-phosphate guanylyltransferase
MMPVLNRPFLEHTITYLKKYGVRDVTLAVSYLPEAIQGYLGDGSNLGVRLTYTVEDVPLGTAGAVRNAQRCLDSTFVVLNGDIFTSLDLIDMLSFHRSKGAKVTIALTWVDNPCAFGVVETDTGDRVRCFLEKPSPDQITTHWINAGIYIIEPEVLKHVPPNSHYMFERGLFPLLLELNEPVYGYPFNGYWLDMGTLEKYLCLNCDLLLMRMESSLVRGLSIDSIHRGEGVTIHPSAKITGPVVIGDGCRINQWAYIKGPVVIGADCHIGDSAGIDEAILWPGVSVGTDAILKRCVVAGNCRVGSNERIVNRVVTLNHAGLAIV